MRYLKVANPDKDVTVFICLEKEFQAKCQLLRDDLIQFLADFFEDLIDCSFCRDPDKLSLLCIVLNNRGGSCQICLQSLLDCL